MPNKFDLYSDATDFVIEKLLNRKVDLGVRHIIITPNPYTLYFEQRLSKNGGFFDAEVLSLSRLYYKLGGKPLLPTESAVMEIKRILKYVQLDCFNKAKGFGGFCQRMLETINRLADSAILPYQLDETNPKLLDVKRVYSEYIKRNPQNLGQSIMELIQNSNYFDSAHVYVVNFDNPTKIEQNIFRLIKQKSLSFYCPIVNGEEHAHSDSNNKPMPNTEIYSAQNKAEEFKAVARRIKKAQSQGVDYADMCVVCDPQSYQTAQRIFSEYEIEHYCDKKTRLISNPLSQFVTTLIKGVANRKDFIKLMKNPYMGISNITVSQFENYCIKYNIDYGLNKPFELGEIEKENPEKARAKVGAKISKFKLGLKEGGLAYLRDFVASIDVIEGDESARSRLNEILLLINNDDEDFKELFCEAAQSAYLRPLPSRCGVGISSAVSTRGKKFKQCFIVDFNEGVMPLNEENLGVIGIRETANLELSPSLESINSHHRSDIFELIYSSQNVFISYVRSASERPSALLYLIKDRAVPVRLISSVEEYNAVLDSTNPQIKADYCACKNGGLEQLLLLMNTKNVFFSSLYTALKDDADKILKKALYAPKKIDGSLFDLSSVSASRLQTFFDCPYKHFIRYGLKAKENEKGGMTALDTGLLIHKIAEQFFLSGFDIDKLDAIITQVIAEFAHKLDDRTATRLSAEIKQLCTHLKSNFDWGDFEPFGAEVKLNDPRFKPTLINGATLNGSIDYVDTYNGYARVIDYKSGFNVSYEPKTLYYGLKLQLPLYMYALNQNGLKSGAMFFFPFRLKWNKDTYQFIGLFNSNYDLVCAFDRRLRAVGNSVDEGSATSNSGIKIESSAVLASVKFDKEIKVSGTGAKTQDELDEITNYAYKLAELAIEQIREGFIEPLPYKNSRKTSCGVCQYKVACDFCGDFRVLGKKGEGDEY